jgi:endogenous inhibitor of DNA gyrase (YacG/DUF329 family)
MIDLGNWAAEKYRVPDSGTQPEDEPQAGPDPDPR